MNDWRYEELATLPDDATPGENGWGYGSDVFGRSGCTIIADNSTPTRVWKLPPAIGLLLERVRSDAFESGKDHVRRTIRDAMGMD